MVRGVNDCGSGAYSSVFPIVVTELPIAAGDILGTSAVCQGQNSVSYTVPTILNATNYS